MTFKIRIPKIIALLLLVTALLSCKKQAKPVKASSITLDASSMTLEVGQIATIVAYVRPDDAENKTVFWSSTNSSVAIVNGGSVSAVGEGSCLITASCGEVSASCSITVLNPNPGPTIIAVSDITLNSSSLTLEKGEYYTLQAVVSPADASNKLVIWSSSNSSVVSVDSDGNLTAVGKGAATITAKADDGGKTAVCTVTVTEPEPVPVPDPEPDPSPAPDPSIVNVEYVHLNTTILILEKGDVANLTALVFPENATNRGVSWSSDNTSVATVDASGTVTAIAPGAANIIVTTHDGGKTDICSVNVTATVPSNIEPLELHVDVTPLTIEKGSVEYIYAEVLPANATHKEVIYKSDNTSVATIDVNGKITAISAGYATITVSTYDGGITAHRSVTVIDPIVKVSGIQLSESNLKMVCGDSKAITATITPANAANKSIVWSCSDSSVITVSSSGVIIACKAGSAVITATTVDGNYSASCNVTVVNQNEAIEEKELF